MGLEGHAEGGTDAPTLGTRVQVVEAVDVLDVYQFKYVVYSDPPDIR